MSKRDERAAAPGHRWLGGAHVTHRAGQVCVGDVMRPAPVVLSAVDPIERARAMLVDHRVTVAPVVSPSRHPLGVISLRDCIEALEGSEFDRSLGLRELALQSASGAAYRLGDEVHLERHLGLTVADVMIHMVFHLSPTASISHAAAYMSFEGVSQLLVVGPGGDLMGMIGTDDITRWVAGEAGFAANLSPATADAGIVHPVEQGTVLVVDDDVTVGESLVEVLEEEGYDGLRALNGRQALNVLRDLPSHPGLILLDLKMPEMSGWEFRHVQLLDPSLRAIPVVILTASRDPSDLNHLGRPAATLHKPIDVDALLSTVTRHLVPPLDVAGVRATNA